MEEEQQDIQAPASEEQAVVEQAEPAQEPTPRMVPLEALESERRKRQDAEAQARAMQDLMSKSKAESALEEDEDGEEFITKAELKSRLAKATFGNKREVLEEAFCSSNPQAIEQINEHLEGIIKRKPWLAQTIDSAPNRFARAYEIVQDYMPKKEVASADKFRSPKAEAKRIVENSQKPGNPATIAKPANLSNTDYLKSIAGKPEFREYRKKMLAGG